MGKEGGKYTGDLAAANPAHRIAAVRIVSADGFVKLPPAGEASVLQGAARRGSVP